MISQALRSAAEEIGFTYAEASRAGKDSLYGIYGGYLVTLYDTGSQKTFFINYYMNADGEDGDDSVRLLEISEALKSAVSGVSVSNYSIENDGLSCTVNGTLDEFLALLDRVLEMLEEKQVTGATHCSCCGNRLGKRYPKKLIKQRQNYLLCEHCALDMLESASKAPADGANALPKRTGLGVLGAVVGGLAGCLLYLLTYSFLAPLFSDSAFEIRYLFSLLGFATAGLVYAGFRFFSKRPCISAYASISAVTLVFVALGQYFGSFVGYAKQQGFTLAQAVRLRSMWLIHLRSTVDKTLSYGEETLRLYDISPLFYKLLLFSLLFALIGSIIFQLGLYEKGKHRAEPVEMETLRISPAAKPGEEPKTER